MLILKKIAPKHVMGNLKDYLLNDEGGYKAEGERFKLYRVSGEATSSEEKDTDFGLSYALKGTFTAEVIEGERAGNFYVSDTCFLANEISSVIARQLKPTVDETSGEIIPADPLEFSFIVWMIVDSLSATSYIYEYETVLDFEMENPLQALTNKLPKLEINKKGEEKSEATSMEKTTDKKAKAKKP